MNAAPAPLPGAKPTHQPLIPDTQALTEVCRTAVEQLGAEYSAAWAAARSVTETVGRFDNDCRSDRTRAGMKAALELGRWVFLAPIGYLNAPRAMARA